VQREGKNKDDRNGDRQHDGDDGVISIMEGSVSKFQ
jgi:hypothetical protein